jgi:Uma2 family endonuclease
MTVKTRMTAEEYYRLPETNLPCQLINGELIEMPSPDLIHQEVVLNIAILLREASLKIGGKVYIAPMDVEFDSENIPQPDIFWIAPDGKCKPNAKNRLAGPPDLIVEVLSPSTARMDKTDKFLLYEKHGVREYWIVDPRRKFLEVWRLEANEYTFGGSYGVGELFTSSVLNNMTIDPTLVFATL